MANASLPVSLSESFDHESLEFFSDVDSGLAGAVAIHSTALGPAMGGLRLRRYKRLDDAGIDALRLARAMTYKNASAGLPLGGRKAVLVDDGQWAGNTRTSRMIAFAAVINRLRGRYITAEDVGTTPADMDLLGSMTPWVAGRSVGSGGRGDPSLATATTVFAAIERAVPIRYSGADLADVRIGVLGAGHVGTHLIDLLLSAGASIYVADIDPMRAARWRYHPQVRIVEVQSFLEREFEVFAPCAFGEVVGEADVGRLRCGVIAGAANNPLVHAGIAAMLHDRDILYVPDFLANCGGIVHVGAEALDLSEDETEQLLFASRDRIAHVLDRAKRGGLLPLELATATVDARLRERATVVVSGP